MQQSEFSARSEKCWSCGFNDIEGTPASSEVQALVRFTLNGRQLWSLKLSYSSSLSPASLSGQDIPLSVSLDDLQWCQDKDPLISDYLRVEAIICLHGMAGHHAQAGEE